MGKKVKIVTIGGGSSYTPELIEGFIKRYEELPIGEMWLVDVEDGRRKVEIIAAYAQRMWDASPYKVKVNYTLDRREALKDADFVTTQFRVGQLGARVKDERIPCLHGMLGQETNGAGGIFKALRTIPVIGEIIEDMKELCPNAFLINFTNPSGMVTEAAIKKFGWKKTIGLCNVPEISERAEHLLIGKEREDLTYRFVGLNHFHWHRVFDKDGKEVTREILKHINEKNGGTPQNIWQGELPMELMDAIGMIPCGYHRYYYSETEMINHLLDDFKNNNGTRAEQMWDLEKKLFDLYSDPKLDHKPEELSKRGGAFYSDTACECISAIYNNKHKRMTVSTLNGGAVPCLPADSIIETTCLIGATGAEPLAFGELGPAERGWLCVMKAMEECTIEAAVTGDYGMLYQAFAINPLIRNGKESKKMMDELLVAHEKYLPKFKDVIARLKKEGVTIDDPVVKDLMDRGL